MKYEICSPETENKFLINDIKRSVYVNGIDEIKTLKEYLQFDFIENEVRKNISNNPIKDTRFIVSCNFKQSIVAEYISSFNSVIGQIFNHGGHSPEKQFDNLSKKAIPLKAFINPKLYPEHII